jgi:hypothetical protein
MSDDPKQTQVGGDHFKNMPIQPIDFIQRNNLGFEEGCIVKYVCRHKQKDGKQDLLKAIHYLQLLIDYDYPENTDDKWKWEKGAREVVAR